MTKIRELEDVLLDQVEKLNDDTLFEDEAELQKVLGRSKQISDIAGNLIELNRLKLDIVKASEANPGVHSLLIEDKGGR